MSNLKKGWEIKKLDDACEVEYGTRVVRKRDGGTIYPVYGGGGATFFMDSYNREKCLVVSRFAMSEQCTRFVNGKFFLNDSGLSVKPKESKEISQDFLNWQFIHLNDFIFSLSRGTAQKNLNIPMFRKIEIHYPKSKLEQKRIVSILDRTFAMVEALETNAEQNLKNTQELFDSFLQEVFDNKGVDWKIKKLGEVCEKIFAGGDKPKEFSKIMTDEFSVSIFANGEKNKGLYGYTNVPKISKPSITVSGRGTIGYSEIRTQPFVPIVRLITLLPNDEIVDINFLHYCLKNIDFSNSGSSIPQLTVPMIKEYLIPIPPLPEQKRIVQKLDVLSTETKKLKSIYQQKIVYLRELKKSILQKAFNGEL